MSVKIRQSIILSLVGAAGGWFLGRTLNSTPWVWPLIGIVLGTIIGLNNDRTESNSSNSISSAKLSTITNNLLFRIILGGIQVATIGALVGEAFGGKEGLMLGGMIGLFIGLLLGMFEQ